MRGRSILLAWLAGWAVACSGGGSNAGPVNQQIEPCAGAVQPTATPGPQPTPSVWPVFDVWRMNADPSDHTTLVVSADTTDAETAAELRLTVACQGTIIAQTIDGMPCSFPPPPNAPGAMPECPLATIPLGSLSNLLRIGCLIEVGPTEPLGIGAGVCANPDRAQYRLRAALDEDDQSLGLAARDCQAPESCLVSYFGINPAPGAPPTPTATP